eukprot:CAMPEP_0175899700 /NCGR_PEP_ID=MMETSP0108-20121206/1944_1 /TAXON_ID=195067 ORGANISM="Goniomonas pacifica, Strain CCMP1869" /NCGR_SAMPLE_ID=MMETSP0108 /ASSEMBLY_ACC=CAM_ASM_000204 /LENGTH=216 /DNA_ID=CAMNT_0017221185 /DNA_START=8 /DNA_END=658 /DNA_ORIENTATION=-
MRRGLAVFAVATLAGIATVALLTLDTPTIVLLPAVPPTVYDFNTENENADWAGTYAPKEKNLPPVHSIIHVRDFNNFPELRPQDGYEQRGSFVVQRIVDVDDNRFWLEVNAAPNHNIQCILRSYRWLSTSEGPNFAGGTGRGSDYRGTLIKTGYRQIWDGLGSIETGNINAGNHQDIDIFGCRDLVTGEIQYWKWGSPLDGPHPFVEGSYHWQETY